MSGREDALPAIGEVFREYGFEGASLSRISEKTGLGKGSLYNFFPGGKEEMAAAVLDHIEAWFETEIFHPLREADDPAAAVRAMFEATDAYFRSGRRVCLVGALALGDVRDRFSARIHDYFAAWRDALAGALVRGGWPADEADAAAEDVVAGIQGALVLSRALDDPEGFRRLLGRMERRLAEA